MGKRFDIHPATAGLILRRNRIQMRPKSLSPQQEVEAERLYGSGLSLKRVGDQLGVDGETVRKMLMRNGVRLRDRHGWTR